MLQDNITQIWSDNNKEKNLIKHVINFHLRDGDLRGGVVVEAEGATLQHLKAKSLTLISINIHRHDCQRKLSGILHLETLPDSEERFVGAQTCEWQTAKFYHEFVLLPYLSV